MTVELPDKWVRKINTRICKLAGASAPPALTFGTLFLGQSLISQIINGELSWSDRFWAVVGLDLLLGAVVMGTIGLQVCRVIWCSQGKSDTGSKGTDIPLDDKPSE